MVRRPWPLIAAVLVLATACGGETSPVAQESPQATAADVGTASTTQTGSCVEQYSLKTLAKRDYAFDGTVKSIEPATDDGPDQIDFTVRTWYRGHDGTTTTRRAYGFGGVTLAGGAPRNVGDRLLVAGDDDFVWECGFTQPYDSKAATDWARTFEP